MRICFDHDKQQLQIYIEINELPGILKLGDLKDSFCPGAIQGQRECYITGVSPPTFSYTMTAVDETCLGTVGTNLDVTFTGEAPFWIEYRIVSSQKSENMRESFRKHRATLSIRPKTEGKFKSFLIKLETPIIMVFNCRVSF